VVLRSERSISTSGFPKYAQGVTVGAVTKGANATSVMGKEVGIGGCATIEQLEETLLLLLLKCDVGEVAPWR